MPHSHKKSKQNNTYNLNKNPTSSRKLSLKHSKRKKKKTLLFKIGILVLLLMILLITTFITILTNMLKKMDNVNINSSNLSITSNEELKKYDGYNQIKNIALFGIDSEDDLNGRSDAILIATIDPIHNKVKLTSLMRDTYVYINGYGYDKLNHAYSYGGPELAIKTINENFGLNIKDFASVNFKSLPKIIDALGGVKINISDDELQYLNGIIIDLKNDYGFKSKVLSKSGLQTLNGVQTLAYTRIRSTSGGDFERTSRQRTVLSAIFDKAKETSITSYPSILNKVLPLIQTNINTSDILALMTRVISLSNGKLEQQRFPMDEYSWGDYVPDNFGNEIWYLMYDDISTKQQIEDYIFDDKSPNIMNRKFN